jgi:8-oxo-dGTP pyrophosphatase MutT (NUDIX family)
MAHRIEDDAGLTRAALLAEPEALARYLRAALAAPSLRRAVAETQQPADARHAAVLLLFHTRSGVPYLLFTRRSAALARHSGEISFPGGSRDPADQSPAATALRETHEEIGVAPERIRVLGELPPSYAAVSNFVITPVVGWLDDAPLLLSPNPAEVADVFAAPLAALADPAIYHSERWLRNGERHLIHFYDYEGHRIWGVTGRILHDLLELLPGWLRPGQATGERGPA